MQKKSDTWISFSQNALLLLIGFILTSVVGAGLTDYYQDRAARKALMLSDAQSTIAEQKDFFMTISPLMDSRIFRMWKLEQFFSGNGSDANKLQDLIASYRIPFVEWNSMLNENLALYSYNFPDTNMPENAPFCLYSNPTNSQRLDLACIQLGFIEANDDLDTLENDFAANSPLLKANLDKYKADLNTLNPQIFLLDQIMLNTLITNREKFEEQLAGGT